MFHAALAFVTLCLVAHHVIGSGFYADTSFKKALILGAGVVAPTLLIAGRRQFPQLLGITRGHVSDASTRAADQLAVAAAFLALLIAILYSILRNFQT